MFTYTYNGTEYEFRLTHGAKAEIEKKNTALLKIPGIAEAAAKMEGGSEDRDMAALLPALLPHLDELQNDDIFDLAYILLKNDRRYRKEMNPELWKDLLDDMTDQLGLEEAYTQLVGVIAEVFTMMERMNKLKEDKIQHAGFIARTAK